MRNRFAQFGKQMIRAALEGFCTVETDAEVPAETRIDLWFMLRESRASLPEHLGLLGAIAGRAGTLELFHNTPSVDELVACLIKQGEFRHDLPTQGRAAAPTSDPVDHLVGPAGPRRLLGAGAVLEHAIVELRALPPDAPERMLALPILQRTRLAMSNPQQRTPDDEEFLRVTEDLYEAWRRQTVQEGVRQGLQEGLERERKLLLRLLRQRFGDQVDGETEQRLAAASVEQIEAWLDRVLSAGSLGELLAD